MPFLCFSQSPDTCLVRLPLPQVGIKATIQGYSFTRDLYINKDSLKRIFSLILSDDSYQILGFEFYYDSEDGDIYHKIVCGPKIFIEKYSVFKNLKKGGIFDFASITIEKAGIRYHAPNFLVYVTE